MITGWPVAVEILDASDLKLSSHEVIDVVDQKRFNEETAEAVHPANHICTGAKHDSHEYLHSSSNISRSKVKLSHIL
jgi:hypothetical protein